MVIKLNIERIKQEFTSSIVIILVSMTTVVVIVTKSRIQ